MSDQWYVRLDGRVRGPATESQLRKALAGGKIQPETPVRSGTDGEWTVVRESPIFAGAAEVGAAEVGAAQVDTGAAFETLIIEDAPRTPLKSHPKLFPRVALVGTVAAAALASGVIAAIQLNRPRPRPSHANSSHEAAVSSTAPQPPAETKEISKTPVDGPKKPAAADTERIVEANKVATAETREPQPSKKVTQPIKEPVTAAPNAAAVPKLTPIALSGGGKPAQSASARDDLDIPWPDPQLADSASEQLDWEKLDTIIREHNKLYETWKKQQHRYHELCIQLMRVGNHLANLQRRAARVQHTMDQIRSFIGDQNAENAAVFAPPETPRWNQSLAKNYTLRTVDMGRLDRQATHAVNEFNTHLRWLDINLANQQKTLARAVELRGEWVRITRPFGLWTRQDRPIPYETSTRWLLTNSVFAPAYLARCIAEIHEKSFEKARDDIELAIKRDPSWAELYAIQAVLNDRAGKHAESERAFKAARRLAKKSSFVEVCEGIAHARHKNYEGAKAKFRTVAKRDAADPTANAELALLLATCPDSKIHDGKSAVEAATAACQSTAWSQWWCLDVLALSYAANGEFDRAIACIRRAKQAGPADVQQVLDDRIASYEKKQLPTASVGEL